MGDLERDRDDAAMRWKPRLVSPATKLWGLLSLVLLCWCALSLVAETMMTGGLWAGVMERARPFLEWSGCRVVLAALCCAAAAASEVVSRFRVPPPVFRVKDQLTRALGDLGLLDLGHKERWRGVYWVAPIGMWNRKARSYSLLFEIGTVKATPELFQEKLAEAVAGFRRVQSVNVEPWVTKRGYRRCFKLTLWYGTNPYGRVLDEMKPW